MKGVRNPGGYSLIKAIWVCAAPKGRVFGPFWFENTLLMLEALNGVVAFTVIG